MSSPLGFGIAMGWEEEKVVEGVCVAIYASG